MTNLNPTNCKDQHEWFYVKEGQRVGPFAEAELKSLAASGTIGPGSLLTTDEGRQATAYELGLFKNNNPSESVSHPPPPPDAPRKIDSPSEKGNDGVTAEITSEVTSNKKITDESIVAMILGGIVLGVIVLVWFVGWGTIFTGILWLMVIVGGLAALGFGIAATKAKDKDERDGLGIFAGICAALCVGSLWFASNRNAVDIPKLSESASAEEVATAYREKSYYIAVAYKSFVERPGFFSTTVESQDDGSLGSGILIANSKSHGIIVTNRHVVDPAFNGKRFADLSIRVKTPVQSNFVPAHIAAIHNELDLALLVIEHEFPNRGAIRVIETKAVRQGEAAVALGNPQGLESIVSEGIISGRVEGFLTTTCPISPGNSGGPLFLGRHGYLVGINTLFLRDSQNLNFAVPAEHVVLSFQEAGHWQWFSHRKTAEQLIKLVPLETSK